MERAQHLTMIKDNPQVALEWQPRSSHRAPQFAFLIADDHPPVTMAVGLVLTQVAGVDAPSPTSFTHSDELLAACALPAPAPRIVILDLIMPGEFKRVALVRELRQIACDARILVYTAEESAFLARATMAAGAMGYVAKTSPANELMNALAAMMAGQYYIDRCIDFDHIKDHPWSSLTDSERSILLAFSRGFNASEIVAASGRRYSTVTTHKYNGLKKLNLRDSSDLLPYLYANGLTYELDGDITSKTKGYVLPT